MKRTTGVDQASELELAGKRQDLTPIPTPIPMCIDIDCTPALVAPMALHRRQRFPGAISS